MEGKVRRKITITKTVATNINCSWYTRQAKEEIEMLEHHITNFDGIF